MQAFFQQEDHARIETYVKIICITYPVVHMVFPALAYGWLFRLKWLMLPRAHAMSASDQGTSGSKRHVGQPIAGRDCWRDGLSPDPRGHRFWPARTWGEAQAGPRQRDLWCEHQHPARASQPPVLRGIDRRRRAA